MLPQSDMRMRRWGKRIRAVACEAAIDLGKGCKLVSLGGLVVGCEVSWRCRETSETLGLLWTIATFLVLWPTTHIRRAVAASRDRGECRAAFLGSQERESARLKIKDGMKM